MTTSIKVKKIPVMAHLVLGYPTLAESINTAEKYIKAGVEILELQVPFSHPTADGPVITAACQVAVEEQKVSVAQSLEAIESIRARHPKQEIIVMSYVNRVFSYGIAKFFEKMEQLNIKHLIIPDLPVDSALAQNIANYKNATNLKLVPVLATNTTAERLEKLSAMHFDFYYLMSDFKITGSGFGLNPNLKGMIAGIKKRNPKARVGIGFGISTPEQAKIVVKEADYAIIGSALITAQNGGTLDLYLDSMQNALN
jgi:tryptophan synthase alpha chain